MSESIAPETGPDVSGGGAASPPAPAAPSVSPGRVVPGIPASPLEGDLAAHPGRYYRNTRYLMVAILFVFGMLSLRDGFIKYPRDNAEARREGLEQLPHPGLDVPFNQVIGVALPPLAVGFLIWALYNSRGFYRVSGTTLYVPGHPPVPFINIRKVDRSRWDRKGIAYIEYTTPGTNRSGLIKLDDFVYDRDGTDRIFERIEKALQQGAVVTTNSAGMPSVAQPTRISAPVTPMPTPPTAATALRPAAVMPPRPRPPQRNAPPPSI